LVQFGNGGRPVAVCCSRGSCHGARRRHHPGPIPL